ncbi:hypothetical protein HHL24_17110 [Paraburkholderia sp. RP-4-7]|uniref:Uncharacterized protein n=1 Tax=Paraburkholderia polaris TaxID=2728848 RepID=A0A848IHE6_9BURK|nr:hypothetical protein [Paraburkholderia polaris]NML99648.1 hypothetical protein [Paraburkholderia polaris]
MPEVREASTVDVQARIRHLEQKRGDLWSIAGGSKSAANIYRAFLDGRRSPSDASLAMAAFEGFDLMDRYRHLLAEKLTRAAIAKAQAKCLTDEIRRLRVGDAP